MSRLPLVLLVAALACRQAAPQHATSTQSAHNEMRTVESVDPGPPVVDPPPMLSDEAPPPKPKGMPWEPPTPVIMTPDDEKVRAALPFSPAIAMDPIDGGKISIRAATPKFEYKNKIYYFSNEENRRAFAANPDQFLKEGFTKL